MKTKTKTMLMTVTLALLTSTVALAHEGKEHPAGTDHSAAKAKGKAAPAKPAAPAAPAAHSAGEDHDHPSPHGGLVSTVDKETHVEVLFSDTDVKVWFYDSQMKPVTLPADAKATAVVGKDVKKLELPGAKNPDGTAADHLSAPLATVKDQKVSIVIQATVAGKARSARVERAAGTTAAPSPAPVAPSAAAPK